MNLFNFQKEYKNIILIIYNNIINKFRNTSIKLIDEQQFYTNLVLYLYNSNKT
jgi:hypothetical protein